MNKKVIKKLVSESYKGSSLDAKKVNKISTLLSKSDLKKYINALKLNEKKNSLIVKTPMNGKTTEINRFKKLFPKKKIVFKKDPNLLLGVQVVDYDIVYDFTLKNSLDRIVSDIEKNYD